MYRPEFHPKTDKDLSKLDKPVIKQIRDKHIPRILQSPHEAGKALSGRLSGLKSYHFTENRVDYRIVYEYANYRIKGHCAFFDGRLQRESLQKSTKKTFRINTFQGAEGNGVQSINVIMVTVLNVVK